MLVMGKAYEASIDFLATDAIVIARGRLDHKGRGETKLVAQELEEFKPTEDEVAKARAAREMEPVIRRVDAAQFGASLVEELKAIFEHFPGESEVILEMQTREGLRRLRFGSEYRVHPSAGLHAELDALLGGAAQAA
jgi:DNA polymerase-3 subunit alpha